MRRVRYDQRVLVLVEVRGEQRDWDQAEREFEEQGWPVVSWFARGEDVSAGVLRADPASRLYAVEVRLFGTRNRRTERAAAWRVQWLARRARLEMYARRCDLVDQDREQLTEWRLHTVGHRPPRAPDPGALTVAQRLRRRWTLARARSTERRGRHDTGHVVTGTASEARRLSRMPMPGGTAAGPATDVRALYGRERSHIVPRREEDMRRRMYRFFGWLVVMVLCAVFARHHSGARTWFWSLAAVACFGGAMRVAFGVFAQGGRWHSLFVAVVAAAVFLSSGLGLTAPDGKPLTPVQVLQVLAVTASVLGLWLLVRQWSWGEWLTWGAPLAFGAVVSFAVTSGSVLHAMYADELDLTVDDLDVPGIWQATSAAKLLSLLSVALCVPAAWGIAKHLHVPIVSPVERLGIPLYVLAQVAVAAICAGLALDSAGNAATAVKSAAESKGPAPSYFGVEPEWTCVEPTVPAAELNTQGGTLRPEHPYLSFGEADGTVALWNAAADKPLKVPAGQVRLLPVNSGRTACSFTYDGHS
ncbi:NnrS multi-domain protein [Streptomyces sp. NBC_01233]|uniref:NnrS multi-domain protein n=1 Tax=Streptomyces sp. NBC_01233 TaxID=2903787 RepID=UPI002E0ED304|nr:NnrS multi-domain protein [Streptomyces sp. NBC_01233]